MDKATYLKLRKELDLERKMGPLLSFFIIDLVLVSVISLLTKHSLFLLSSPLIAVLMFRNFSLMHDAVHGAISSKKRLNNLIGLWSGTVCLLPYQAWKDSHLKHHYWSGNIEKDPVMAMRTRLPQAPSWVQTFFSFSWRNWLPTLATLQYSLFWALAVKFAIQKNTSKDWIAVSIPLLCWGLFTASVSTMFLLWTLLPGLILYMLVTELINLPHHLQLPTVTGNQRFHAWEQHVTARSCIYPSWFAKNIALNFNLHTEHHMFPEAPWYTLDIIAKELPKHLGNKINTDHLFDWSLENRSNLLTTVINPQVEPPFPLEKTS